MNAETQAVVLETVADASWNAGSPVSGLSETVGAVGAQVGPWDVGQAVGDGGEADAVDQHGGVVAGQADGAWGSVGVVDASWHHGDDHADGPASQEVALNASDAVAVGVNGGAGSNTAPNAVAVHEVVKFGVVARHAVEVGWVPENASLAEGSGDCGGAGSGLRVDLKRDQAKSKYEELVHLDLQLPRRAHLKRFGKQIRRLYG